MSLDIPTPHSDRTERVLLAGCIYTTIRSGDGRKSPYWQIAPAIERTDFYREHHRHLWTAIESIADSAAEVWADGVISELDRADKLRGKLEGGQYVRRLADNAPTDGASLQGLAHEVSELARRRRIQKACEAVAYDLGDGTPSEGATKALSDALQYRDDDSRGTPADTLSEQYLERLEHGDTQHRFPVGVEPVDKALHGGLVSGRYYLLAARPKMGKTKLAVAMATALLVEHNYTVDFWFTDGHRLDLYREFIAALSHVNTKALQDAEGADDGVAALERNGRNAFGDAAQAIGQAKDEWGGRLRVYQRTSPSPTEIQQTARARAAEADRYAVFVDYLQNCDAGHTGRSAGRLNTEAASKAMREMRSQLGALCFGLAQFNRSPRQGSPDELPKPYQLKSAGALEQDANDVLIWHRPHFLDDEIEDPALNRKGVLWHCMSKHEKEAMVAIDADLGRNRFNSWDEAKVRGGYRD